jgi:hypothetical protein
MSGEPTTFFDATAERLSRRLARGYSRRSLLAQFGRGAVALSVGTAAYTVVEGEDLAQAHIVGCPCFQCNNNVISCNDYWGQNQCPGGTCGCGWWTTCEATPCSTRKVWSDCCSDGSSSSPCGQGAFCYKGYPICFFHKSYGCGCGTSAAHVVCRRWYCAGSGSCDEHC